MLKRLTAFLGRFGHLRNRDDFADELEAHRQLQLDEAIESGLSEKEASNFAQRRLGPSQRIIEICRDGEWMTWIETWMRDVAVAFRALRKAPVYSIIAVLTLAIGIGANTAVFSLLYGLSLRSLPVPDANRLARVEIAGPKIDADSSFLAYSMLLELQRSSKSFQSIAGWAEYTFSLRDQEGTFRNYYGAFCTGRAFDVLGIKPYLGRFFSSSDDRQAARSSDRPVVISHGFWSTYFASDPHVVGRRVDFQNAAGVVIGVAPPSFTGILPGWESRIFVPIQMAPLLLGEEHLLAPTSSWTIDVLARLHDGVSFAQAEAELATRTPELLKLLPEKILRNPAIEHAAVRVSPGRTGMPSFFESYYAAPLLLLQGLVAAVLLLCCSNVAGLMMSAVYARRQEFAVRAALGGSRWRLMRQHLTESLIIASAGAALGGAAAWYASLFPLQFLRRPEMFESLSIRPDIGIFLATGLLAIVVTLLSGTLPAVRVGQTDPGLMLRARNMLSHRRHATGRAFIPIQVGLSVVLVASAGLLSESLKHLRRTPLGFDAAHVTIQTPQLSAIYRINGQARLEIYGRIIDSVSQEKDVRGAALTWFTPFSGLPPFVSFRGVSDSKTHHNPVSVTYNAVGAGYFRTMGTRLMSGKEFDRQDRTLAVCILNKAAADRLFPRENPLNQRVSRDISQGKESYHYMKALSGVTSCQVVGVSEDAKFATVQDAAPATIYFPITGASLEDLGNLVFLINSEKKKDAVEAYTAAVRRIAPSLPLVLFVTLKEQFDAALGSQILITALSRLFAVLALFLSALGVYGLLSASVAQRTAEIGLRVAVGADKKSIIRMILIDGSRLLLWGFTAGFILLLIAVRFIKHMLYGIGSYDPVIIAATIFTLSAGALLAAYLPANRAARIDPTEALRIT